MYDRLLHFKERSSGLKRQLFPLFKIQFFLVFFFCCCCLVGWFFCFVLSLVFRDRVSLYSPGCPGTHSVDQAGLELRNPPASASRALGLKACPTTPGPWKAQLVKRLVNKHKVLLWSSEPLWNCPGVEACSVCLVGWFWLGVTTTWRTVLRGCSIRKVENSWARQASVLGSAWFSTPALWL